MSFHELAPSWLMALAPLALRLVRGVGQPLRALPCFYSSIGTCVWCVCLCCRRLFHTPTRVDLCTTSALPSSTAAATRFSPAIIFLIKLSLMQRVRVFPGVQLPKRQLFCMHQLFASHCSPPPSPPLTHRPSPHCARTNHI